MLWVVAFYIKLYFLVKQAFAEKQMNDGAMSYVFLYVILV